MLNRKARRRRRRTRSRYDRKGQSGLVKALLYLAAIAALSVVAIVMYAVFLGTYYSGNGDSTLDIIAEMILYLMSTLGLLIAYTCRFWSVSNDTSPVETLWRAALCGALYPIMVILLRLIVWSGASVFEYQGILDNLNVTLVALIISFVLSFPLTAIGVVRPPLKQP
jgi:hypothetical protein